MPVVHLSLIEYLHPPIIRLIGVADLVTHLHPGTKGKDERPILLAGGGLGIVHLQADMGYRALSLGLVIVKVGNALLPDSLPTMK